MKYVAVLALAFGVVMAQPPFLQRGPGGPGGPFKLDPNSACAQVASCAQDAGKAKALQLLGVSEDELKAAARPLAKCAFACAKEAMPQGGDSDGDNDSDGPGRGGPFPGGHGPFPGGRGPFPQVGGNTDFASLRAKMEAARECAKNALGVEPHEAVQQCLKDQGVEVPELPQGFPGGPRFGGRVDGQSQTEVDVAGAGVRGSGRGRAGFGVRGTRQTGGILGELFAQCPQAAADCRSNPELTDLLAKFQTIDKNDVRQAVCEVKTQCDADGKCKQEMEAKKAEFEKFRAAQCKCQSDMADKLTAAGCDVPEKPKAPCDQPPKEHDFPNLDKICSGEQDIDVKQLIKMLQKHARAGGAGGFPGLQGRVSFSGGARAGGSA